MIFYYTLVMEKMLAALGKVKFIVKVFMAETTYII
tara:strand:+ start:76 stop:180 length:105 start_codon:yes stop_codon:yes gene_type:complete